MKRANKKEIDADAGPYASMFQTVKISDAQFKKFSELIYQKAGIHLKPEKKELLNARLGKRLRACQAGSFKEYYDLVVNDKSGQELIHLIDSVSTNFTSFFREQAHFDFLTNHALPAILQNKPHTDKEVLIWSAACSSGEEPYTLAMVLGEYLSKYSDWDYRIIATDISTKVLSSAERGIYAMERVNKVPREILQKYFQKGVGRSTGFVKIKKDLQRMITFRRLNLMDEFNWEKPFDIIFCRNAMIYFDKVTQQKLIDKFYQWLAPGGFMCIGHSESLSGLQHGFKQLVAATYQK